jgi:hypothetical protein
MCDDGGDFAGGDVEIAVGEDHSRFLSIVMPGLVPGIHVLLALFL